MLNWDDEEQGEEFLTATNEDLQSHNREIKYCMLDDPDCEACQ